MFNMSGIQESFFGDRMQAYASDHLGPGLRIRS